MKKYLLMIINKMLELYCRIPEKELMNSDMWVYRIHKRFLLLTRFIKGFSLNIFLRPVVNEISIAISSGVLEKEYLKNSLVETFKKSNDEEKFFLTKIFYVLGIIEDDICEIILKFATDTNNKLYRYWITMDISKMTFHLQNGFYDRYYEDRRLLMQKIALENCCSICKQNNDVIKDKVLVIMYLMDDNIQNSMQRVSVMIANALSKRCSEVTVVSLDSFSLSNDERKEITTLFKSKKSENLKEQVRQLYCKDVKIEFVYGENYRERMQNILKFIYNYNPGCIVDITDEFSPTSYFYHKDFFTCYIPLRNNISSSFYTYMLSYRWQHLEERKKFYLKEDFKNKDWMFPEYVPDIGKIFTKKEIGVSEDSFVIVSIGNVKNGFTDSFVEKMRRILEQNESLVWLLVGNGMPSIMDNSFDRLIDSRRIIDWGYEKNLYGICAACDIQLRPDITGGSGATAICSMLGNPLVMRNMVCDCLRWLGKDFSSLESDEDIISEIMHLYNSKEYYEECSIAIKSKVTVACNADYWWDELYSIIMQGDNIE